MKTVTGLSTDLHSEKEFCDDDDQDPTYVPDEDDYISDSESQSDGNSDIYPAITAEASGKCRYSICYLVRWKLCRITSISTGLVCWSSLSKFEVVLTGQ